MKKQPSPITWLRRVILEYLYPPRCICCKNETPIGASTGEYVMLADPDSELRSVFCARCMSDFLTSCAARCNMCGRPYSSCTCSPDAVRDAGIDKTHVCFGYDKTRRGCASSRLIYSLKSMDNKDTVNFAAHLLCGRIKEVIGGDVGDLVVAYAPRRRASVREHGGDHMRETAKLIAKEFGCGFADAFYSRASGEQKKRSAAERKEAVGGIMVRKDAYKLRGRRVIIVDDIITSGATLGRCASLAFDAGARDVAIFALARTIGSKKE